MNPNLKRFSIFPSVVPADKESEISFVSYDENFKFYDDVTYEIQFVPQDESDVLTDDEMSLLGYNKARKTYFVKPQNGVIKISYFFCHEQEWRIHVSTKEYAKYQNPMYAHYTEYWGPTIDYPKSGVDLFVYSLEEDLYSRRVLSGDFHVHTTASDGKDGADIVCAFYRKAGRDFLAVTDHHVYNASEAAKEKLSFAKNFTIIRGEEVHNGYVGSFHMVNVGSNYSVNDIYLNTPDRVKKEVSELEGKICVPEGLDKREYLNRVWLYREIKKSGGLAIFAHPCWSVGFLNTSSKMSDAVLQTPLCDAFEVIGGPGSPERNNMQVAQYIEARAKGVDVPVVGSTDSHSVMSDSHTEAFTIVFAKDNDIVGGVRDNYSVAVETVTGEHPRAYGHRRLVWYAHFLLTNYFPVHNELCALSGCLLEAYVKGDENAKSDAIRAEERIENFENKFFGR